MSQDFQCPSWSSSGLVPFNDDSYDFEAFLSTAVMFNLTALPYLATLGPDRRRRRYNATGLLPGVNTASRGSFDCPNCQKTYKWYRGLHRHLKYECGKAPRFKCPHCMYTGKHRSHVYSHIKSNHRNRPVYALDTQQV